MTFAPIAEEQKYDLDLVIRLPKVDPGKIVEHNGNKVLAKTIYLTDESSSADLCENLESNSRAIVAENEAHLLAALELMNPKKDQLAKVALRFHSHLLHLQDFSKGRPMIQMLARDITVEINPMVIAAEGEPQKNL